MANTRAQYANSLPKEIENPKNRKDEQYNAVIKHLVNKSCPFTASAATTGFVTKFANALRYIDGPR